MPRRDQVAPLDVRQLRSAKASAIGAVMIVTTVIGNAFRRRATNRTDSASR
jgi:hypothetical protein